MPPENDLRALLTGMDPMLDPVEWVFCAVDASCAVTALDPLLVFREAEATTLIIERAVAERHGIAYRFCARRIEARVYSALDAVGFLAAMSTALAERGIAVNAVSAYHHDHLFVPADRAGEALEVLRSL